MQVASAVFWSSFSVSSFTGKPVRGLRWRSCQLGCAIGDRVLGHGEPIIMGVNSVCHACFELARVCLSLIDAAAMGFFVVVCI